MASLGSTPGLIVAAGVGAAAATALEPAFEVPRQDAWSRLPNRLLDPGRLAALVAQGGVLLGDPSGSTAGSAYAEAIRQGYSSDKLDRLIYLAQRAPDLALVLELWRRGRFGTPDPANPPSQVTHAFAKEQIEPQYWTPIADLFNERLSAQAVALGIIRSVLNDPGFFPVNLQTSGGVVPAYPVSTIDPLAEALATGFDEERLRVMVASIGRPPGPGELARAVFRQLIKLPDFNRGILEGDTRPEWAETFLDVNRDIPSSRDFVQLHLRGWTDAAGMYAGTARHGMSQADTDTLYEVERRPLNVHAITTGLARGGKFQPQPGEITDPYQAAVHQADLGPEWYDLQVANKYLYPSAFVLRSLAQAGDLGDTAAVEQILLEIGWRPDFAALVAQSWTTGTAAAKDPYIGKAETQLWTAVHKAYKGGGITAVQAENLLNLLISTPGDVQQVLYLWEAERTLTVPSGPVT